jgi:dihydrofolate reductase
MITVTTPATTVLLGRKNYEGFAYYWPSVANDETADPRDRAFSKWLNSVEKIVFSSTLKVPTWENSHIVNADPATVIKDLRQHQGGDIIVLASGSTAAATFISSPVSRSTYTPSGRIFASASRPDAGALSR